MSRRNIGKDTEALIDRMDKDGLPYSQIASIAGVSESYVRKHVGKENLVWQQDWCERWEEWRENVRAALGQRP